MKTISILLAWVSSPAAGVVIAASLPAIHLVRPAASLWNVTKVVSGICISGAGILTWVAASRSMNQRLVLLTGLFLVSLSTASAVWTIQLALRSGRIKDHLLLYGGSHAAQGATSL